MRSTCTILLVCLGLAGCGDRRPDPRGVGRDEVLVQIAATGRADTRPDQARLTAGVETIASINDFLRDALPFYPNLREEMLRIVLVHPGEYILPEIGEKLAEARRKSDELHTGPATKERDARLETIGREISVLGERMKALVAQLIAD